MPSLISFLAFVFFVVPSSGVYSVTSDPQAVTFYNLAYEVYGTPGILAHADLAGAAFFELDEGDKVTLTYTDNVEVFSVMDIRQYRATAPADIWSGFVNLESGVSHGSEELGHIMYDSGNALVLQTCIERDGNENWGRLFVILEPVRYAPERKFRK